MKLKHFPFSKEIHRIMIRYLTFEIVLHNRHKNFYAPVQAPVQLLVKDTRDKENKEKTKKQTQQPSCSSHLNKWTKDMREQNTKAQEKNKNCNMIPNPCRTTHTLI